MGSGVYKRTKDPWNKGKHGLQKAWNKDLTKETDERVMKMSLKLVGHECTQTTKDLIAIGCQGYKPWNKGLTKLDDLRIMGSAIKMKGVWTDPEYVWNTIEGKERIATKILQANVEKPNGLERKCMDLFGKESLWMFHYVGDGTLWISGMNPDFINIDKKQIIEAYGCFWHCCKKCGHLNRGRRRQNDTLRINKFKKLGYSVLVIWEHELKNSEKTMLRIKKFVEVDND